MVPMGALTVFADSGTTGECRWSLNGTVLTISGRGKMSDYYYNNNPWGKSITKIVIEYGVINIGEKAFYNCDSLKEIKIPSSVTCIGSSAFEECDNLHNIDLNYNLQEIGYKAFYKTGYYNKLSNWHDEVLYIDNYLICAKNSLSGKCNIKETTVCIADFAFSSCELLTEVVIPGTVSNIGIYAFVDCISLEKVDINDGVKKIGACAFQNTSFYDITIPDSVAELGMGCFMCCSNLEEIIIGKGISRINIFTFQGCNIKEISIPKNVKEIAGEAFACKNLKKVKAYCSTKINDYSFKDCNKLKSVTLKHNYVTEVIEQATDYKTMIERKVCSVCEMIKSERVIPKTTKKKEENSKDSKVESEIFNKKAEDKVNSKSNGEISASKSGYDDLFNDIHKGNTIGSVENVESKEEKTIPITLVMLLCFVWVILILLIVFLIRFIIKSKKNL